MSHDRQPLYLLPHVSSYHSVRFHNDSYPGKGEAMSSIVVYGTLRYQDMIYPERNNKLRYQWGSSHPLRSLSLKTPNNNDLCRISPVIVLLEWPQFDIQGRPKQDIISLALLGPVNALRCQCHVEFEHESSDDNLGMHVCRTIGADISKIPDQVVEARPTFAQHSSEDRSRRVSLPFYCRFETGYRPTSETEGTPWRG